MIIEKYFGIDREAAQQLIDSTKNMTHEKSGDNGFQNTKVFLFDEYAVLQEENLNFRNVSTADPDLKHLEDIAVTLLDLQTQGVNVVPILAFQSDNGNGYIIQSRAKGAELYDRDKVQSSDKDYILERIELLSNAPQEHFDKFLADAIKIIVDARIIVDFIGKDNFFYDETIGFQFIDLHSHDDYVYGLDDEKLQVKHAVKGCFLPCYYDTVPQHRDTVSKILPKLTDKERAILKERNKKIFEKCRDSMINNGIAEEAVSEIIRSNEYISRMQQLDLL